MPRESRRQFYSTDPSLPAPLPPGPPPPQRPESPPPTPPTEPPPMPRTDPPPTTEPEPPVIAHGRRRKRLRSGAKASPRRVRVIEF